MRELETRLILTKFERENFNIEDLLRSKKFEYRIK